MNIQIRQVKIFKNLYHETNTEEKSSDWVTNEAKMEKQINDWLKSTQPNIIRITPFAQGDYMGLPVMAVLVEFYPKNEESNPNSRL
ncbi:MAG: hypothetical protein A2373_03720 [Candidatus Magasanikbacteria bacterium RIFOXYB1_FULL_40_15]|uniref:Uncharacterized protein n=1 Tax=Candidatus Magasanikbacteria bacterium RIFOXYB1_FULL_40_15 TaxID=1798697 RepID=A0A1F6NEM0_9BACT|nr:MAG: hypothetical protein A2373_03720 [Candidatus Magasanikbacteria bacterium RIFOXYB1_FULL_40_15]